MTQIVPNIGKVEPLSQGNVHIWQATIDCSGPWLSRAYYSRILSASEVENYGGFVDLQAGREYLLGRIMMRTVLSTYFPHLSAREWHFAFNNHGKPYVRQSARRDGLEFSLSHSGGAVVLALTIGAEIGIDLEAHTKTIDIMSLATDVFSRAEILSLKALGPALARQCFFKFWTLKEAYIKARGLGLALPLDQFTFRICDGPPVDDNISITFASGIHDEPNRWWFSIREFCGHPMALAVKRDGTAEQVLIFDFDTALSPIGA